MILSKTELLRSVSALGALCVPFNAHGQSVESPIAERVGPNASQQYPAFPDVVEFPNTTPKAMDILSESGFAHFSDVEIDQTSSYPAMALPGWKPTEDERSGLKLDMSPGEVFDAAWIRRQFYINGLFAPEVPLDQIASLVELINRAFVANGYINSGLLLDGDPPTDGGSLKLRLISGRIADDSAGSPGLTIKWGASGRNRLSENFVVNRMAAVKDVPLNAITIEKQFRLLAENSAIRTVNADLRPGARPGEAQLTLTVDPNPLVDFYVSAANSRSPSIGGERYSVGGSFRNALRPGDFFSAETGRVGSKYDFVAGYETPFLGPRTFLRARGGFNNAAVIDPQLLALNIEASDWHVEGGLSHILKQRPLSPRREGGGWQSARSITVGLNVSHRQSKTKLFGRPFSFSPGAVNGRTEYTALRLNADMVQRGINTVFAISLTGTQGLEGTGLNVPGLVSPDKNFRSIRGQVSYARRLNDNNLELRVRAAGQWADGILYSGERFAAGGAQTVRGYRETLVLSDTGVTGSIELAQSFSLSPKKASRSNFDIGSFAASAFVDGAVSHNREGSIANPKSIASIGASLAWTPSRAIRAEATYGYALKSAAIPGSRDLQDRGFHFRITFRPLELFRR